jgi:hypothetical protein
MRPLPVACRRLNGAYLPFRKPFLAMRECRPYPLVMQGFARTAGPGKTKGT